MGQKQRTRKRSVLREHSLSLTVVAIMALWFVLYVRGDPSTHLGSFYGNALADWLGTFLIVIATSTSTKSAPRKAGPRIPSRAGQSCVSSSITR